MSVDVVWKDVLLVLIDRLHELGHGGLVQSLINYDDDIVWPHHACGWIFTNWSQLSPSVGDAAMIALFFEIVDACDQDCGSELPSTGSCRGYLMRMIGNERRR